MDDLTKKDWGRIFSPCMLVTAFLIVVLIAAFIGLRKSAGWSMLGIITSSALIVLFLVIDIVVKLFTKGNTLALWVTEIVLIIIGVVLFRYYFP